MAKEKNAKELIEEIRENIKSLRIIECSNSFCMLLDMLPDKKDYETQYLTLVADLEIMAAMMGFAPIAMNGHKESEELIEELKSGNPQKLKGETYRKVFLQSVQGKFDILLKNIEIDMRCSSGLFQEMKSQSESINVNQIKVKLESFVSREAMLFLHASGSQTEHDAASLKLYEEWEEYRCKVFNSIVTSHIWGEADSDAFHDLILSPTIDFVTSQLLVSAITLSAATFFDFRKFFLLYSIYGEAKEEELKQRALIGLLLVLTNYTGEYDSMDIWEDLRNEIKESPEMLADIVNVQKLLTVAVDSEKVSRDFSRGMFKSMSLKLMKELQQNLSDSLDDEDGYDILMDDEENGEESGLMDDEANSPSEMEEMRDKGVDLLLSQFEYLKGKTPFFDKAYNWFMPFYIDNPHVTKALGNRKKFATAFLSTANSCPADSYALANLFIIDPNGMPQEMERAIEEKEKLSGGDSAETSEKSVKSIRVEYIRNLYRFFKYFSRKQEFFNMLEKQKTGEYGYAILAAGLFKDSFFDKYRLSLARFAFRKNVPTMMDAMLRNFEDETLEIQFMKGWVCVYTEDKDSIRKGVEYFNKILKQAPDMKRAYLVLAFCYWMLGETDLYLENFDKLLGLEDSLSEEGLLNLKIDKLEILVDAKRWEEALPLAYELDYTHPEKDVPAAILNYLLVRNGGEHAQENLQKARERLDAYYEEDDGFADELMEAKKSTKAAFKQTLGFFFRMLQKDKKAEAYNHYTRGLIFLTDKDWTRATHEFINAYAAFKSLFNKDKFYDVFLEDGKWLEKEYGIVHSDLLIIYNHVVDEFQNTVNEMRSYGKK